MEYFSKLQDGHKLLYDYFTIREVVLILLLMLLSPSEHSFVYLNFSYLSQYVVTSTKLNQTSFDGSLLYRKSPKGKFIWEYSLIVYKHQPDGNVERLLDKALYTGWTRDLLAFVVEFEKDKDFLTLNTSLASTYLNGWKIKERNPPLKYHRKQIESYESIRSNMQFLLVWTGQGPPTTQFIDLLLHGAEQPTVISFVTNSGDDTDGHKVIGTNGGIIPLTEDLLFHTRNIYQVLLFCHHLGIEVVDCEKIECEKPNNVEEQKIIVLKTWLERGERTWKDFITALAMMKQCVLAKELTREHNVYFYNSDNALEMCGMTLNDY